MNPHSGLHVPILLAAEVVMCIMKLTLADMYLISDIIPLLLLPTFQ